MSNDVPAGRTIAHYRILGTVGRGGMAIVYLAEDLRHARKVALKVVRPELVGALGHERFLREITTTANLRHPHILPLYDSGTGAEESGDGGLLYYVMPFVEGESLRDRLDREKQLPVDDALEITGQVADALTYAHSRGVVHRDIKPANILLERGHAVVADFGIARAVHEAGSSTLTSTGLALGTPAYMSPEQAAGATDIDGRSDVYALGCVLYEMLAGDPPFRGPTVDSVVRQHMVAEPPLVTVLRPAVPERVATALRRAMAKTPTDRFPTATSFAEALQPGGVPPATSAPAGRLSRSRRPWARWAIGSGVAVVLAAAAIERLRVGAAGRDSGYGPRMVVLPFAPAAEDSTLERMSRELVVTLTAGLDGMGELRTVSALTVLARVPPRQTFSLDEAHVLARRLRASRLIHGGLTRAGAGFRLDASLYDVGSPEPIARASVTAGDPVDLGDAATIALLDELWQTEPPPVPSLAAVTRSSVPAARRAYLLGELALSRFEMAASIEAFERAFAADTTFWWAYWRSLYPRMYGETSAPDRELVRKVVEHRSELPEPDRLLIEATYLPTSRDERLRRLRALTERYPHYEPGWYEYANMLTHTGGYHGFTYEDARAALERVLALNPRFAPAWEHLQWVAIALRDSALVNRSTREAIRLTPDVGLGAEANGFRLIRAQGASTVVLPPDSLAGIVDAIFLNPIATAGDGYAMGLLFDGRSAFQIQLNRAILALSPATAPHALLWQGQVLAWVSRGAWDSAFVAAAEWSRVAPGPVGALGTYRVAVAGVMTGALPAAAARAWRPSTDGSMPRWTLRQQSDLAWQDGVLAYLDQDQRGLTSARRALAGDSTILGGFLQRSLAALAADADGERLRAARELAAVESEMADRGLITAIAHPTLASTNRILAARWYRSVGDDVEAARLLTWHESFPGNALVLKAWNLAVGGTSLLDRAEIAESRGDFNRARTDYERFLQQFDLPDPPLRPLIARAEAGLERVSKAARR